MSSENDTVFEATAWKLLVDGRASSSSAARSSTMRKPAGAGFKVENPNVVAACGRGPPSG
jgi:Fe-S cluster assembly iron-binding protein IscA